MKEQELIEKLINLNYIIQKQRDQIEALEAYIKALERISGVANITKDKFVNYTINDLRKAYAKDRKATEEAAEKYE